MALININEFKRQRGIVHLIGVGDWNKVIPAKKLRPGHLIVWNWGYVSEVISVTPSKSGKSIIAVIKSLRSGELYSRRFNADRLIAITDRA